MGKCPECGERITHYRIEVVDAKDGQGARWRALSLVCPAPNCGAVISAQLDPMSIKAELATEIGRAAAALEKSMKKEIASAVEELKQFQSRRS